MSKCDNCGNFNGVRCQLLGTCPYPDSPFTSLTVGKGTPLKEVKDKLNKESNDALLRRIKKLEDTVVTLVECVDALLADKLKKSVKVREEYDPSQDVQPLIRSRCHEGRGHIPADTKPPRTR